MSETLWHNMTKEQRQARRDWYKSLTKEQQQAEDARYAEEYDKQAAEEARQEAASARTALYDVLVQNDLMDGDPAVGYTMTLGLPDTQTKPCPACKEIAVIEALFGRLSDLAAKNPSGVFNIIAAYLRNADAESNLDSPTPTAFSKCRYANANTNVAAGA